MLLCEVSERVASEDIMAFGTYVSDVILVLEDAEVKVIIVATHKDLLALQTGPQPDFRLQKRLPHLVQYHVHGRVRQQFSAVRQDVFQIICRVVGHDVKAGMTGFAKDTHI